RLCCRRAVSVQAICFSYRLDNDGESQPTDIAQPLSARALTLTEQNNYARFKSHYKAGTLMDKTYIYLPARNVRNTIIGYELAGNIRKARAT
ncbi:hypothetical protein U1839_21700, partial [Sphingomonas sp. RT2P30]|uniref:hypothetical protein n=1 Tax=Parasphingomonas halimpatiens TaxID=3096162 RepID=UPI002FC82E5D